MMMKLSFSLGKYEEYAIKSCAVENRNIYSLSDSQAAVKALESYQINSEWFGTAINPSCNWSDITELNGYGYWATRVLLVTKRPNNW
jgi:hypothetical protein